MAMAVGCSTQATGPAAIKIGLSTALSGPAAPWGIPHLQAAELVADKYNADGGIYIEAAGKKLPIEIIAYDDKYTPSEAAIAGKKLIEQDKVHVIANMGEEMATTIRGMANDAGIIQWGTSWELSDPHPDYPLSFSCLTRNLEMAAPGLAWFHNSIDASALKLGSIAVNNAGGVKEHEIMAAGGSSVGMELVFWDVFDWGQVDFAPMLLKAIDAGVEVFAFSSAPPDVVGLVAKQAIELGYTGYFLGFMSHLSIIAEIAGADNIEGKAYSVGELGQPIPPSAKGYAEAFVAKYDDTHYESVLMPWLQSWEPIFEAIERTQSLDAEILAEDLRTGTFSTIGGEVTFEGADYYGIDNQMLAPLPVVGSQGGSPVLLDWAYPVAYPAK